MLNKVMLIGHLGQTPEIKYSTNGTPMTSLNVATDESYTDKDGNKVEKTEWHRVQVFQRQAENCCKFLTKGSLVFVEGSLQTRKWTDQQGQDRYMTEVKAQRVQFLDRKGSQGGQGGFQGGADGYQGGRGDGYQGNQGAQRGGGYRNQGQPYEDGGNYTSGSEETDKFPF